MEDKTSRGGMRNMTEGSPAGHIFYFALPLLAGSFLQQLYNMVDSWVVGNYVGDAALAAVGFGFPAVSYTHLDVYKRQDLSGERRQQLHHRHRHPC